MAITLIPTSQEFSIYSMRLALDDEVFNFDFRYNSRENTWYIDLFDSGFNAIRHGIPLRSMAYPWSNLADSAGPAGEAFVLDPTGQDREPGRNNLGTEIKLVYIDIDSVLEVLSGT